MGKLLRNTVAYLVLGLMSINLTSCAGWWIAGGLAAVGIYVSSSGDDDDDTPAATAAGQSVIGGMVFQQTSDNNMVPAGGSTVTAEWTEESSTQSLFSQYVTPKSKATKTDSDGSYQISGVPQNKQVKITITNPDTTQSIQNLTTSEDSHSVSSILKGKGKKIGLIKKSQDSVLNTFDDTSMPGCQISIPTGAVTNDVDNVSLIPTHQAENLPPLPDGYAFLAGADFKAPSSVTFASGKEATPYIILPSHLKAEDLSTSDIKLMEFIDGNWVITTPSGEGKIFTTGTWAGYLGPDDTTPAKLKGLRPWCWVVVQPALAQISGTVRDNSGNPIKGAFVFGGGSTTNSKSDGTYMLKNVSVIKPNTLMAINAMAKNYQPAYQFVSVSPGAAVNNVDFALEPVSQLGEVYGKVTNAADASAIYGAMVTLQTNPGIRGMKYDNKTTPTDLTDDTFYVIPPPGVTITQYKWILVLPSGQKFNSAIENGSSVVLNQLATEATNAGYSLNIGAYKVELEITYSGGKKGLVSGGFLVKQSGFINYIADVRLPVSIQDQLTLKSVTDSLGNYRFVNLPTGETFNGWAKADGFITSNPVQIPALGAGEKREQNFSLAAVTTDTTPPSQPVITGTAQSAFAILLTWGASTDNVGIDYYRVYRNGIEIGKTTGTSYLDSGLSPSTTYQYIIGAFDKADNSALSSSINVTTPSDVTDTTPPSNPSNLSASVINSNQINLSWFASSDDVGVTGYKVYRDSVQINTTNTTNYADTGLSASTMYEYKLKAYDAAGNISGFSTAVTTTTSAAADTTPPTVPANLTAVALSSGSIGLTWTGSTDAVGVTGYKIYRGGVYITSVGSNSHTDSGLSASTNYTYNVAAYDAAGNTSAQSSPANATTQAPSGNLVAHWKFDETAGTTAADASGNANNGTVYGTTWSGGTLSFDGTDDYVNMGDVTFLDSATNCTIECWFKADVLPDISEGSQKQIIGKMKDDNGDVNTFKILLDGTSGTPKFRGKWVFSDDTYINLLGSSNPAAGTWYHIVFVLDGSSGSKLYINGVLDGQDNTYVGKALKNSSASLMVGRRSDINVEPKWFDGLIDCSVSEPFEIF
ncbi:MAG: fibronectin type III domain-containing protein [Planctomycetota bacterium]